MGWKKERFWGDAVLRAESTEHGWHEMYADRYPHAGGEQHVALYVESSEGFEVEIVVEVRS